MPAGKITGQGSAGAGQNRLYFDVSGTGAGPFAEATVLLDGLGNIISPGGAIVSTVSFTKPADATAYAAGDHIANSLTGASVVPMTFTPAETLAGGGRLTGVRCTITPASGNLVITNCAFDLLLFRPATDIPFAAGSFPADNAALAVSPVALRSLVGVFPFVAGAWRNPAGSVAAGGLAGWQAVASAGRSPAVFDLSALAGATTLVGVLQAQAAWTPGAVAQQFDFALEVEAA